jgi:pimeloyl-ACP methyl ester carboxylesterase
VRLIAVDRPGYGGSTFKRRRQIPEWPADIAQLAAAMNIARFAVIGLSGGAPYALACAQRFGRDLQSVVIISGEPPQVTKRSPWWRKAFSWWSNKTRFFPRAFFAMQAFGVRHAPRFTMALLARSITFSKRDKELWKSDELREGFAENLKHAFAQGTSGLDEDLRLYTQRWGFDLEHIDVRVHWFHGDADRIVPISHVREQIPALRDLVFKTYPDEGHFMVIEHLDDILRVIAGLSAPVQTPVSAEQPLV